MPHRVVARSQPRRRRPQWRLRHWQLHSLTRSGACLTHLQHRRSTTCQGGLRGLCALRGARALRALCALRGARALYENHEAAEHGEPPAANAPLALLALDCRYILFRLAHKNTLSSRLMADLVHQDTIANRLVLSSESKFVEFSQTIVVLPGVCRRSGAAFTPLRQLPMRFVAAVNGALRFGAPQGALSAFRSEPSRLAVAPLPPGFPHGEQPRVLATVK